MAATHLHLSTWKPSARKAQRGCFGPELPGAFPESLRLELHHHGMVLKFGACGLEGSHPLDGRHTSSLGLQAAMVGVPSREIKRAKRPRRCRELRSGVTGRHGRHAALWATNVTPTGRKGL